MRKPDRLRSVSLSVLVSVFVVLAPCQARAFLDDDVWVTSGIIAGITLGACVAIVLLAGLLTDLKGETDAAGTDREEAVETALDRLPPGLTGQTLARPPWGLCAPDGGLRAAERKGRTYTALEEPIFARYSHEYAWPALRPENLPRLPRLARTPEIPSARPSIMGVHSLFQGEDGGRSCLLY